MSKHKHTTTPAAQAAGAAERPAEQTDQAESDKSVTGETPAGGTTGTSGENGDTEGEPPAPEDGGGKSGSSPTPTSADSAEGQKETAPVTGSEESKAQVIGTADMGETGRWSTGPTSDGMATTANPHGRRTLLEEPETREESGIPPHGAQPLSEIDPRASPTPETVPTPRGASPLSEMMGKAGRDALARRSPVPSLLGMAGLEAARAQPAGPPEPSVGRIVHYVLTGGCNAGATRAAMVTRTHDDWEGGAAMVVNLNVFCDRATDYARETPEEFTADTPYDESGTPGTWHWPARV